MMARKPALWTHLPVLAALLCIAQPSLAENMLDNMFTFRKDQKPLITPRRAVPVKVVTQPYYPDTEHVAWSNFYTRKDLAPEDYLSSSASKVMRPQQTEQANAGDQGGWPAIAERAAANAQAESMGNIAIGDPGQGIGMEQGDAKIGRGTQIGAAIKDWRDGDSGPNITSRPGDYDYRAPVGGADSYAGSPRAQFDTATAQGGAVVTDTDAQPTINVEFKNDPRYVEFNKQGKVSKYAVQGGDTLGSISNQPAIYGTWKLWPLIYSANRRAIGGDPDNLKAKQRLDIPRDYTDKQAKDAERRALKRKPGVAGDGE